MFQGTTPTHKILLYGNSIQIDGLFSKLEGVEGWQVARANGTNLDDLNDADFIVADLRDARSMQAVNGLKKMKDVSLIGLDALTSSVRVLAGHAPQAPYMQDVLNLLKKFI